MRILRDRGSLRLLLLAAAAALCLAAVYATPLRDGIERALRSAADEDRLDPVSFTLLSALLIGVGVPRLFFAAVAGALFGVGLGFVLAESAALLGCLLTFFSARALAREALWTRLERRARRVRGLLEAAGRHGVAANVLVRSAPVGNFFVTNLLMALSPIRPRDLLIGTTIGTLPGTLSFVLFGSAARERTLLQALFGGAVFLGFALLYARTLLPRLRKRVEEQRAAESDSRGSLDPRGLSIGEVDGRASPPPS